MSLTVFANDITALAVFGIVDVGNRPVKGFNDGTANSVIMIGGCNNHEIIAADMPDEIHGRPKFDNRFAYNDGSGLDQFIAPGIPITVVKGLEIIYIQQTKCDRLF